MPLKTMLFSIISNPTFIFGALAITNILFITTALLFFSTVYLIITLQGDSTVIYSTFGAIIVTAPIFGQLCATHYMSSKSLGKNAIYLCLFMQIIFFALSYTCALITNYIVFIVLLWFLIYIMVFLMLIMNKILLSLITPVIRPTASTVLKAF